jgi:hypothetical protein
MCYVHLEKEDRDALRLLKTAPTGMAAVHLGYDHNRRGYYVFIPQIKRYTTVRSIRFDERKMAEFPSLIRSESLVKPEGTTKQKHKTSTDQVRINNQQNATPPATALMPAPAAEHDAVAANLWPDPQAAANVTCGADTAVLKVSDVGPIAPPKDFQDAMSREDAPKWLEACKSDIAGKLANGKRGAWDLVDMVIAINAGRKPLKGKWVFKVKYESDGFTVKEYKARWVACGYTQIKDIDYKETFASTIRAVTVRLLLAEAAELDLCLAVLDVVKAFTLSEVDEDMYVEQPHGFAVPGKVCKLNMALEGTKQAAHLWQQNLNSFMIDYGFERCATDPCLYKMIMGESKMFVAVHVDDLLIAYSDAEMFREFEAKFRSRFNCKRSEIDTYLGMEVVRNRAQRTVTITQRVYIEKMASRFLIGNNTKEWSTPCNGSRDGVQKFYSIKPAETEREKNAMFGKDYLGLLGSLLYAACMTRPDIAFYTAYLCQFMHAPSIEAWEMAMSVAAYLNKTAELGLTYGGARRPCCVADASRFTPVCISDASFGVGPNPFGGGLIDWRNAALVWISRKLKFVPLSSCEAEVGALVVMLKELLFVVQLLDFFEVKLEGASPAITDNKAAHDVVRCPGATKRTAHFDRWLHFARELVLRGTVEVFLTGTFNMPADMYTKPLDKTGFLRCRKYNMNLTD